MCGIKQHYILHELLVQQASMQRRWDSSPYDSGKTLKQLVFHHHTTHTMFWPGWVVS